MAVFVLGSVGLLSALDGGLRWADGWWLIGVLSLALGLLCLAGLVAGLTAAGAIDHLRRLADRARC